MFGFDAEFGLADSPAIGSVMLFFYNERQKTRRQVDFRGHTTFPEPSPSAGGLFITILGEIWAGVTAIGFGSSCRMDIFVSRERETTTIVEAWANTMA
jgi:hypothetical protein